MSTPVNSVARRKPVNDSAAEAVARSLIIPSYNPRDHLADCPESIYQKPPSVPPEDLAELDDITIAHAAETFGRRRREPTVRIWERPVRRAATALNLTGGNPDRRVDR
jgi:hypothetical protein